MSAQKPVIEEMEHRLRAAFEVEALALEDESEQHRGHAGWREGGNTHFHIALQSPVFKGMSRIARHRAVHIALGADLVARIHALRLTLG